LAAGLFGQDAAPPLPLTAGLFGQPAGVEEASEQRLETLTVVRGPPEGGKGEACLIDWLLQPVFDRIVTGYTGRIPRGDLIDDGGEETFEVLAG